MYKIIYTASYNRRASKFLKKHPDLLPVYRKTLLLLERNPQHPSLRLHPLKGSLKGLHSVSINLNYRITLELVIQEKNIIPIMIGVTGRFKTSHQWSIQNQPLDDPIYDVF